MIRKKNKRQKSEAMEALDEAVLKQRRQKMANQDDMNELMAILELPEFQTLRNDEKEAAFVDLIQPHTAFRSDAVFKAIVDLAKGQVLYHPAIIVNELDEMAFVIPFIQRYHQSMSEVFVTSKDERILNLMEMYLGFFDLSMTRELGDPYRDIRTRRQFTFVLNVAQLMTSPNVHDFYQYVSTEYDDLQELKGSHRDMPFMMLLRAREVLTERGEALVLIRRVLLFTEVMRYAVEHGWIKVVAECDDYSIIIVTKTKNEDITFYYLDDDQKEMLRQLQQDGVTVKNDVVLEKGQLAPNVYINDVSGKLAHPIALKEIATVFRGMGRTMRDETEESLGKIVTGSNLEAGFVKVNELSNMEFPDHIRAEKWEEQRLKENDIVIVVRGREFKAAIVGTEAEEMALYPAQPLAVIRLTDNRFTPEYVYSYFLSDLGQQALQSIMTVGKSVMKTMNIKDLANLQIEMGTTTSRELATNAMVALRAQYIEATEQVRHVLNQMPSVFEDAQD